MDMLPLPKSAICGKNVLVLIHDLLHTIKWCASLIALSENLCEQLY